MRLVNVNEYSRLSSIAPSTVRMLCKQGRLPALKMGRGWRIDLDKAEAMVAAEVKENMETPAYREKVRLEKVKRGAYLHALEQARLTAIAEARAKAMQPKEVRRDHE